MTKKGFYWLMSVFSVGGLLWVLFNKFEPSTASLTGICLFRRVTGVPCPSCGSTRAVVKLAELQPLEAFSLNPLGFVLAFGLIVFPLWLLYDGLGRKTSLYLAFVATESFIRRRWVSAALVLLIAANWLWNIYKHAA